ncbi:unnamed protein product [Closterium sp. NIES-53]
MELLPQANYTVPTKQNRQQVQRWKPGGGGSGGGRLMKDIDEKKSAQDSGPDSSGQLQEAGRRRSANGRRSRDKRMRKEKQVSKKVSSTKDVDSSSSKGRGDGEASCSMVGVMEPTLLLATEAREDFKAVAATM